MNRNWWQKEVAYQIYPHEASKEIHQEMNNPRFQ